MTNAKIASISGQKSRRLWPRSPTTPDVSSKGGKQRQIDCASHNCKGASLIKRADKTSNLLATAKNPPP